MATLSNTINPNKSDLRDVNAQGANVGDYARDTSGSLYRWTGEQWTSEGGGGGVGMTGLPNQPQLESERIAQLITQNQQAVQPAISSLEATKPKTSALYEAQRSTLEGEKEPLKERYQNLINQIKGTTQQTINRQTAATSAELGARGISGPLAQQTIASAIAPIEENLGYQIKDIGFQQESDLRNLANQIAMSYPQEALALQEIANQIAGYQAGAGQTGIAQGLSSAQNMMQNYFSNLAMQETKRANLAQEQYYKDQLANQLKIAQLENPDPSLQAKTLQDIMNKYANQTNQTTTQTTNQNPPYSTPKGFVQDTAPTQPSTPETKTQTPKKTTKENPLSRILNYIFSPIGLGVKY